MASQAVPAPGDRKTTLALEKAARNGPASFKLLPIMTIGSCAIASAGQAGDAFQQNDDAPAKGRTHKDIMTNIDFFAPARLYLGRDWPSARAQGPRAFSTAAKAICFAVEEAAPVSLHGAVLLVAGHKFSGAEIRALYQQAGYPLQRKSEMRLAA